MIKKILFGSFANLVAIIVLITTGLVRSGLAVRYLSNIEAGVWFLFLNAITIISFCDFGLNPTLSRAIGFSHKKKNSTLRISNLFLTTRRMIHIISVLFILFLFCFWHFYLQHLSSDPQLIKTELYAFVIFGLGMIVQFQANPYLAVIYGVGNVATERNIRSFGAFAGTLISLFLVGIKGYGLYGLVIGYFLQSLMIFLLAIGFLQHTVNISKNARFFFVIFKSILAPSMQLFIMGVGSFLILQISNFIIAYVMSIQYVSQFAVILQIVTLIMIMAGVIGYVIPPFVSQAKSKNDIERVKYYFSLSVRSSTAIAIILSIFLYFLIDPITQIWLGKNFVINKEAFLIMLIVSVLEAHHASCAAIAIATGYVRFALIAIIAGIVNLLLSFVFIHFWGLFGAALAIFISQVFTSNWYAVVVSLIKLQYPIKKYLFEIVIPLLLFSIYMFVVMYLNNYFMNMQNLYLRLLTAIVIVCCEVCVGAWVFLTSSGEKSYIKSKLVGDRQCQKNHYFQ